MDTTVKTRMSTHMKPLRSDPTLRSPGMGGGGKERRNRRMVAWMTV